MKPAERLLQEAQGREEQRRKLIEAGKIRLQSSEEQTEVVLKAKKLLDALRAIQDRSR